MTPGIYTDLSDRDYFTETDWCSYSQLKRHLPEWFKPFTGSPAADLGSVLHERLNGGSTPVQTVDAATWQGKAAKEAREAISASGGYAILTGDIPLLDGMEQAVRAHGEARRLLVESPGAWEVSVFAEVEGVPSKARFDRLLDSGVAVDVKTTSKGPGTYNLTRAVVDYGYDLQAQHYTRVAAAAGIELDAFLFVFIESAPPHHVTVVELDEAFLARGEALRDLALQRWLHPDFVESYPGESGRLTLAMPRWAAL